MTRMLLRGLVGSIAGAAYSVLLRWCFGMGPDAAFAATVVPCAVALVVFWWPSAVKR